MKPQFLFLASLSCTLLSACSTLDPLGVPSGTTTASGTVVDQTTGQAIPNATVEVGNLNGYWTGTGNAPTTQADANGQFSVSFDASSDHSYSLFAHTTAGYSSAYGACEKLKNGGRNNNLTVRAIAPAWVKINCIDVPPYGPAWLRVYEYSTGAADLKQFIGPGDVSIFRPVMSHSSGTIGYEVTNLNNGLPVGQSEGRIPYNVAGFDTATVTIRF